MMGTFFWVGGLNPISSQALSAIAEGEIAESTLTYYVFPSPRGISWNSPRALTWSALWNMLPTRHEVEHSIGHVNVEMDCRNPDSGGMGVVAGRSVAIAGRSVVTAGMTTAATDNSRQMILSDGYGLGVLLLSLPGRLEFGADLAPQLPKRFETGDISVIKFRISDETCQRLLDYRSEYESRGYSANYGLPNRPRYGEGAGCSAFGTSFLEVAGLLTEEHFREWTRTIRFPEWTIGGPITGRKVSIAKLLFSFSSRWANKDEPHQEVFFWDPDLMHEWIVRNFDSNREGFTYFSDGNAKGMTIDARDVATPNEPFWKHE